MSVTDVQIYSWLAARHRLTVDQIDRLSDFEILHYYLSPAYEGVDDDDGGFRPAICSWIDAKVSEGWTPEQIEKELDRRAANG